MSAAAATGGPSAWLAFAASLVGGGIAGTLITTYTTAGRERRAARARVRECLAETEDTRWIDADYQEFRKALTRLDSAAIIARFDRRLIHRYTYLVEVAHYTELTYRQKYPDFPPRSLPAELAVLIEGVVATIANEAWRPRFWRFRRKRYIWVLDNTLQRRRTENPDWAWNATLFKPSLMTKEPGIKATIKRILRRYRKWRSAGLPTIRPPEAVG